MGAKDRGNVKGKRGKVMLAVAAAAVLLAVAAAASLWGGRDNDPGQLLSAPAAEILGGERYYLKYVDRWLFGDGSPAELEEARDGAVFLQRYQVDGVPLTTLSRGRTAKVWSGEEFVQELSLDADPAEMYADLRFTGETGYAALGEQTLFFEEYSYRYNGERFRLRFLFAEGQLWGLEYGGDGRCMEIITLSGELPEETAALMRETERLP